MSAGTTTRFQTNSSSPLHEQSPCFRAPFSRARFERQRDATHCSLAFRTDIHFRNWPWAVCACTLWLRLCRAKKCPAWRWLRVAANPGTNSAARRRVHQLHFAHSHLASSRMDFKSSNVMRFGKAPLNRSGTAASLQRRLDSLTAKRTASASLLASVCLITALNSDAGMSIVVFLTAEPGADPARAQLPVVAGQEGRTANHVNQANSPEVVRAPLAPAACSTDVAARSGLPESLPGRGRRTGAPPRSAEDGRPYNCSRL